MREDFIYDKLNRLTGIVEGNDTTACFDYDAYGRMLRKYMHSALVFDSASYNSGNRPHAIAQAKTINNLPTHRMSYTHFDKLSELEMDTLVLSYNYGFEHQRLHMTETNSEGDTLWQKEYVDNCEYVIDGSDNTALTYLCGPLGIFGVHEERGETMPRRYFIHPDHLGSWTLVTDHQANIVQDVMYDVWGTPYSFTTTGTEPANSLLFDRGFTGHEHLLYFGLINMNGRMYDPFTSSFLSVDNYVQSPDYTQSFNRYAYCLNNPLKYTDPDGEFFILDAWLSGFFQGFFSTDQNRLSNGWNKANQLAANDAKILGGLFIPDMNKGFFGRHWQVLSRLTWEAPQTTLGSNISLVNNLFGQVDKVEYYDGSTVCSGNFWGMGSAVTLGCYINGSGGLSANPNNTTFQHEYGHYLQSQKMGIAYLNRVGIPSLFSNHNHDFHPVEQDANRRAFLYFNEHVEGFYKSEDDMHNDGGWDFFNNPLNIKGIIERDQYVDYYDASSLQLLDKLSIHAKWYDYASYSCLLFPIGPMAVGLFNSIYYNANY